MMTTYTILTADSGWVPLAWEETASGLSVGQVWSFISDLKTNPWWLNRICRVEWSDGTQQPLSEWVYDFAQFESIGARK